MVQIARQNARVHLFQDAMILLFEPAKRNAGQGRITRPEHGERVARAGPVVEERIVQVEENRVAAGQPYDASPGHYTQRPRRFEGYRDDMGSTSRWPGRMTLPFKWFSARRLSIHARGSSVVGAKRTASPQSVSPR